LDFIASRKPDCKVFNKVTYKNITELFKKNNSVILIYNGSFFKLKKAAYIAGNTIIVSSDATNNPPIMVTAIPPNIGSDNSGAIPSIVVPADIPTGTVLDRAAIIID